MTDQSSKGQDAMTQDAHSSDAEPTPKPNKDGLIPGQPVDLETVRRIEKKHAKARADQDAKAKAQKAKG